MTAEKVDFTGVTDEGVTWTLLATLYLRAYESRAERSILADHYAAEAMERIDYDFDRFDRKLNPRANQFLVALRARQLDDWCRTFLARHPDATVLQLGCGLDSRMLRLQPPATVRWFDLDMPEVIELRRKIYPANEGYEMIGASVTGKDWLDAVPADRPVLVVAEGLLPYLEKDEIHSLLGRLTTRFGEGELVFDATAPWIARAVKLFRWGLRDGRELERAHPRLKRAEQVSFSKHYEQIHDRTYRAVYKWGRLFPLFKNCATLFRFTF